MFGFLSKGKMEILLPRTSYAYNEVIEGKVSMELDNPQKAKGVSIELLGERKRRETRHVTRGGKRVTEHVTHTDVVFSRSLILDVEKEYPGKQIIEYPFQFVVPDPGKPQQPNFGEGTIGNILKVMQEYAPPPSPIEWFIKAKLDKSGFDVNKSIRLYIS